jgi:uncharacterized repeat protein (TIGR01451 family)
VVRVPQYSSLTMTANIVPPFWNGGTGGIIALDVQGQLNFGTAVINASGLGFRGGAGIKQVYNSAAATSQFVTAGPPDLTAAATNLNAQKGEGIAGTPRFVNVLGATTATNTGTDGYPGGSSSRGAPGNAGGGGNDNGNNSGGGGGGNAGPGGRGGNSTLNTLIGGEPGATFASSPSVLIMGGGGGAGTTNDGSGAGGTGFASSGAPGGGLVIVRTATVSGTGGIVVDGANAPSGVLNDGAGGGGAGGSILLTATSSQAGLASLTLSAKGGAGGTTRPVDANNGSTAHGPGGGGGGGVIFTTGPTSTTLAASTTGGAAGTSTPGGTTTGTATSNFGAAAGSNASAANGSTSTSNAIANSISGAVCSTTISGTVFTDTNYGGGAGRPYSTANTSAVNSGAANNGIASAGTTVELYNTSTNAFVASTTTSASGTYSFTGLTAGTSYRVRVVNSTVKSSRTPGATGVIPVQTFRTTAFTGTGLGTAVPDVNRVGGEAPERQDAGANSGTQALTALTAGTQTPQSIATVTPGTSGVDFGFNFDVVVNTNDAGQGSLRQFILNANALGSENLLFQEGSNAAGALPSGRETSIFMIPNGTARPGLLASGNGGPASQLNGSGVAVISPTTILPTITGALTSLDATTQTFNIGNSNAGTLGAGGTVGTGATALSTVNRPEVQLVGTRAFDGVVVGATTTTVRGFSLYGFDHNITVNNDITAFLIEQNVVGTSATSFTDPGVGVRTLNEGILLNNADNGTVRNNLSGFNGGMGVWVQGFGNGSNGNLISNNEIRGNGQESRPAPEGLVFDGMELQGASTNNTVSGNLITANYGHGIDSFGNGIGGNTVSGNTISNNGVGVATNTGEEGSGLRLFGATNLTRITNNVLSGNNGSGVLVSGSSNNITISQNSTFGNTRLGIDLISETGAPVFYNGQTGTASNVTTNDSGDGDTGGNGLLNFPVITRATLTANGLLVQGFARPGSTIELFTADNAANSVAANAGFGQGRTYLGTFTEGSTTGTSPDTDAGTGTYGPGTVNGLNQGTDNTNAFSFLIPLTGNFAGLAAGTTLTSTATLNNSTSEFSGNATLAALSGYVYEDVNYGGGAGRPRSASGTVGRPGATVELYNGTTLVSTTTTDSNGQYTFSTTPGTYTVRVVNSTVSSSRTGYVAGLLPVQTYNGTTTAVGGATPNFTDAPANNGSQSLTALSSGTTTPQSIATINTTSAATAGPDFGFNFDVVVNTNDAGQGSLRQFILNANALGGEANLAQAGSNTAGTLLGGRETSIFMIPNAALTGGVAAITPATELPAITGTLTSIDGTTQTFNIGNTNNVALGAGGTVGIAATALSQLNGPEVQLKGSNSFNGLSLTANNTTVRGLSLYGFSDNIVGGPNYTGTLIEQNVIGASATSFTDPGGTNRTLNEGIDLNGSDNGIVRNNLIGFNGGMGIWVAPDFNDANNGANGNLISGNEIRGNGLLTVPGAGERLVFDGIEVLGSSTNTTVSGNLITANYGHGIDSADNGIGGNTVSGNTISNNGVGVATNTGEEGSGLRIFGATNPTLINNNVLSGNNGSGVLVLGTANQVTISQNSTSGNTRLGIDLLSTAETNYNSTAAGTPFWNGNTGATPNVTLNDSGDGDTGGNGLLNNPVLTTATLNATTLTVTGYARPGSLVELFLATPLGTDPTASNRYFGQGSSFLTSRTEGLTADDSNTGTSTYGPANINGVAQGTDNTNLFTFGIPLSSLTAAQRTALANSSALLTATATITRNTSEFSANTRVLQAPMPNDVTNVSIASNQPAPVVLNPNLSASASGFTGDITTNTANTIASYVVNPIAAAQGILYYNGTAVTAATTVPAANLGQLTFLPTRGFSGNATFTYTATDANGQTSTTHNTNGTVTDGPAVYTIPVTASADVTASLTGGTTLSPGQPTGYYTATFTNLGPDAASNVTRVVTLPTGASLTSAQQNALTTAYSGTTVATTGSGTSAVTTITFPPATTLAGGAATSYRFAFTAPTTAGSSTLTASTSTTSSEGANVAANSASLALTTTPVVDVQATLAVTGAATVAPGATATFTATFTNNGTPSAAGVVPTVQLIPGLTTTTLTVGGQTGTLSGTTITFANGATYSTTTGQITYPTTTLGGGASLSSAIAFTMPGSGVVTGTAAVTTTTTDSNPANNVNSASITAAPRFDLATTLSGPTAVVAGSPVTLNVTTTNNGLQAIAGAVQTVQLPSGLNPTAGSPGVFVSNGGTYDNTSGVVTFPALGSLPSGQTVANTITFLAPTAAFTPSAQVTPNTTGAGDTNTANNVAYLNGAASSTATGATLTPAAATGTPANLVATLTTTSTIVDAATQVTYTVGATNAGPGAAANTTGRLQLLPGLNATTLLVNGLGGTLQPDNVTYTFADGTAYKSASYNSQTGLLSYTATATSLASGSGFTFPVAVTVPTSVGNEGQLLATNSVGSTTPESVPADNVQAATVTVRPRTDLATTLTGPTTGVVPGQSVTYTAAFTNNGPNAALATTETAQLPSGLTASTLTVGGQTGTLNGATNTITFANGATYSTITGLVTLPALASNATGAVQTFGLTFVAPAQSYVVSSAISSATTDGTPANNAASVATTVTPTTDVAVALAGPATAVVGNYATYTVTTTNNGPGTATNVVPTLRLPSGLAIQSASTGYTYDSSTGLLTFAASSTLQAGVSTENFVTFTMPNAAGGQLSALASVSTATLDNVAANNTAALTTSVAPATTPAPSAATTADLVTTITPANNTVAPGSTVTYTATYRNAGTLAATNVVPTVTLPTGLPVADLQVGGTTGTLANGLITFANGATYDVATGLLSFPVVASLAPSTTATSFSIAFSAPASGTLTIVSAVTSNTTDLNPADNRSTSTLTVNSAFDLTTGISGPLAALAGSQNVYTIRTTNNGPSSVASATQTVQLPANLTTSTLLVAGQTGTVSGSTISFSNTGASYNTSSGLLTFATISNLAPGAGSTVSNTITVTMPATGPLTIGNATVSTAVAGETNTNNNTATFTTTTAPLSFAPVARNVVNTLRSPEGNTANPLAISPLNATDADGSISNYYVQSLPTAGTLYYNGVAISSIPTGGYQVADASLLSYKPASGFVGNAFFTYTATDNSGVVSNPALYTIPVAQDQASAYTAYNTTKGGTTAYQTNDILAQVIDPNKAVYTSAGTIFDPTTGALQTGAANGLLTTGTNAVLATTGPSDNPTNTLPSGVSLDPATGRIYVSDASQLVNNPTARTYSVFVNTTDANGGITQALATFTLGAYPLPVVLTDFTAQAVQNRDAQLRWHTASERNNDHFEIERSFDGTSFTKIGRVAGQGTTTSATVYAFTDANVAAKASGPVYYRLRQVDRDGTATYSPLRTVSFTKAAIVSLSVYPNPVATRTNLDLGQLPATGTYQVLLLDATGRQVQTWTLLGGATHPLDVAGLASGSYLLVVTGQQPDGSLLKQTMRLTKE